MFTLGDGSTNDGYFEQDGYHITPTATNSSREQRLGIKPKDGNRNPCDATVQPRQRSRGRSQDTQGQSYSNRMSDIRCFYCDETGHVPPLSADGRKVQCHTDKCFHHKAKFFTATWVTGNDEVADLVPQHTAGTENGNDRHVLQPNAPEHASMDVLKSTIRGNG